MTKYVAAIARAPTAVWRRLLVATASETPTAATTALTTSAWRTTAGSASKTATYFVMMVVRLFSPERYEDY